MLYAKRTQKYVNYETTLDAKLARKYQWVQVKYDGWWACVSIKKGKARIYSRQDVLKDERDVPKSMEDCVLIGEYLVGTQRSAGSADEGMFVAFDIVERGGKFVGDHPYDRRYRAASEIICGTNWMTIAKNYPAEDHRRVWDEFVVGGNCEGVVFRAMGDTYHGATIGRVKRTFTVDYVVMDVVPGDGKHKGRMGAVVCGLYENGKLVEKVRVGGGWTDQERDLIWRRPKHYIGRVLEVRGHQLFDSGALRHPNAVQFREDKDASECVFKKEVR